MTHVAIVSTVLETHAGTLLVPCMSFAAPTKDEAKSLADANVRELSTLMRDVLAGSIVGEAGGGRVVPMGPVVQFLRHLGIGKVNFAVSVQEARTGQLIEAPRPAGILLV